MPFTWYFFENACKSVKPDSNLIEIRRGRLSNSLQKVWVPLQICWSWCWWCLGWKRVFSHSHSLWRRVFQISFSESALLRFAFLKARPLDSPFWKRASQIRLSEGAPFRLELLRNRLVGSKLLRNHLRNHFRKRFRNRCSYTLDSVPLHSAQPALVMEWSGKP